MGWRNGIVGQGMASPTFNWFAKVPDRTSVGRFQARLRFQSLPLGLDAG